MLHRINIKQSLISFLRLSLTAVMISFFAVPAVFAQTMPTSGTSEATQALDEIKDMLATAKARRSKNNNPNYSELSVYGQISFYGDELARMSNTTQWGNRKGQNIKTYLDAVGDHLDRALKNGRINEDEYRKLQASFITLGRQAEEYQQEYWQNKEEQRRENLQEREDKLRKKAAAGEISDEKLDRKLDRIHHKKINSRQREERRTEKIARRTGKGIEKLMGCPTTAQYKARYTAGCWTCLVFEPLTSAFLWAADKGLAVTQSAGKMLLLMGSLLWLAFWALKNVSSFTELQVGNILNDLLKFCFKVALAYIFIVNSSTAIGQYFIKPIMGVGASIAQQLWDSKTKQYTQDFVWEDEYISEEDQKNVEQALDATNQAGGAPLDSAAADVEVPEQVEPDEYEDTVQQFQKALVGQLQEQLKTLQNSCKEKPYVSDGDPKCRQITDENGTQCRHYASCEDKGHREAVRQIYSDAGSQLGEGAYCMMAITAALENINDEVGGDITNFQTGKGYCLDGIKVGAEYENSAVVGKSGGDVDLTSAMSYANVGDIIYIKVSGRVAGQTGSGSGYHAVVYAGNGKLISFNGDGIYSSPSAFGSNPVGKIVRTSEVVRARLKANGGAGIDKAKLDELADKANITQTLVNYKGGTYTGLVGVNYDALVVDIPEQIPYGGPTNIMPESIMNSILGAIRAITNETSGIMILGNIMTCYATEGGRWNLEMFGAELLSAPNIFIWIAGAIIWCMGFMLVVAIGYYLVDISFKIGFAVLAFPIVMGLWPFNVTQGKLFTVISIIAKAAALFAFMAITVNFGMLLLGQAVASGGFDELYAKIDLLAQGASDDQEDELKEYINNAFSLFSASFVMIMFTLIYFFKLVQKTSSDLVNKFFPDNAFGDSSPMHSGATMMTSYAKKLAMKASGADLAKDIVAHQAGRLVKGGLQKTGNALAHPMQTARGIGRGAAAAGRAVGRAGRFVGNKLRGK